MPTLYKQNWPAFWTPNADDKNGDPQGLLRCDNLTQDEDGVLSLIRGTKKISSGPFPSDPTQLYGISMNLNAVVDSPGGYPNPAHLRYVVLQKGVQVLRNFGPAKAIDQYQIGIVSGGGGNLGVGFGYGGGHVFITSGTQKIKDNGIIQTPIGITANAPPVCSPLPPQTIAMRGSTSFYVEFNKVENDTVYDDTSDYVLIDTNRDTNRARVIAGDTAVINIDATAFGGVPFRDGPDDIFSIVVRPGDTQTFIKFRIEYLCQDPPVPGGLDFTINEYFAKEWGIESFNSGINVWSTLSCRRNEFERFGTDSSLGWHTIKGIRVTFVCSDYQICAFNQPKFTGGTLGSLDGEYAYVQVDVNNNTYYTEKGLPSDPTRKFTLIKTGMLVDPNQVAGSANECWIFRSSNSVPDFYRIKVLAGAANFDPPQFEDRMSDEEALQIGIKLDYFQSNLPDDIIGIETNFKGRNWYMTLEDIFPSYRDNFSSYDTRHVIHTGGNTEYNIFITKVSTDSLILATNRDFYEISGSAGTIVENNIEFFDLSVKPLGIKSPAVNREFVVREGNLFYISGDGIRVLAGSSCKLLTDNIDLLFKGFNRHGIAPVRKDVTALYGLTIANNQLYFSTQQTDNKRALYVFNFADGRWRYEEHGDSDSIQAIFTEEDQTIIYSTASFGDRFMRQLDVGTLFDETTNIPFKFLTVYDNNQAPKNRKDAFTLKVVADSNATGIQITLRGLKDDKTPVVYSVPTNFDGKSEQFFSIYSVIALVKSFQLEITGTTPRFKLYNFSIDYDQRPDQLNNLRLPPNNFGIAGRKRINEIPFVIDTLGNNVTFTPILDGVYQTPQNVNTNEKTLVNYLFPGDAAAYDIWGGFTGGLFEFYELIQPREIELLPDPIKYKWVPYTNLGNASRKRFIQYAIVIDTRGVPIQMTPVIDGINQFTQSVTTSRKQSVAYTFDTFAVGIDVACILQSALPFEFYEINLQECISEKLPPVSTHFHIPYTNFNTSARKRISQFAFVIDTRGCNVVFTPMVDGAAYTTQIVNTQRKETVIYTFDTPVTGVDMGGTLDSGICDFEYYGPNLDDAVYEKLPAKTQAMEIGCTNYGSAARKRIRTIPFVIDTFGHNVIYTPVVDGVDYPTSTHNTNRKATVLHYFENRGNGTPFGIDYCGRLQGTHDFEFYGLLPPENVENLPVGKKYDQFGPVEFSKVGKIREVSIKMMATGTYINYKIFASDNPLFAGSFQTIPDQERSYVVSLPKGINPNIFRMEMDSPNVFHRFDIEVKVNVDGAVTQNKRIKIK